VSVIDALFDRFGLSRPVQSDGSGLSAVNRSSARRLVSWLATLDGSSVGSTLRTSLAVACVDGTLRSRMCGTPAAGVVAAKTGALDNVVTIAGFTTTASGRPAVFSVLLSGVVSSARGRAAIDQALVAITSFQG
jgi:D-alanyl-D-alanine carboxypeptidase/D-alanyl-D-alanine-endopeptidase (penicillin-binding protein 4)